jgi:UDP-N-acetylmuramoyl-tripeptide--D-alanyl-D-alanine ligase
MENIYLALSVGKYFGIDEKTSLKKICQYKPSLKRSQFVKIGKNSFIVDCYNANPSSMRLALESFVKSAKHPRGVILGDMLELGTYSEEEHREIVGYIAKEDLECVIFIGNEFKQALDKVDFEYKWFPSSEEASKWFSKQDFDGFSFILKGSRGIKVENVLVDML